MPKSHLYCGLFFPPPRRIFTRINKKAFYVLASLFQVAQSLHRHSFIISYNIFCEIFGKRIGIILVKSGAGKATVFECNLQKAPLRLKSKLLLRNSLLGMFFSPFLFNLKYETVISVISYRSNFSLFRPRSKVPRC